MKNRLPTVMMYGGGRQTIAIIVLILQGKLPMPDFIVVADTGREKQTTWDYLEKWVRPAIPMPIHRVDKSEHATVDLYRETKSGDRYLLIPAFTKEIDGAVGKLETYCSNEWKLRVCDRFLKRKIGISDWISWIGYSSDEPKRFNAKRRSMGDSVWFPLVDGVPKTKEECVNLVIEYGWDMPKHSACYMCPLQDDGNWLDNSPGDMERAIILERQMQFHDPNVFLHRSLVPIGEVVFDRKKQAKEPCDSGVCML
jgi:hypothetical protein